MAVYAKHVLPRLLDATSHSDAETRLRQRVCAGLYGQLIEVGFGSGLNVQHYPDAVTRVHAVEPSDVAWGLAHQRIAGTRPPVERSGLDGQSLPFADDTFDSALTTWTLCTIPDPRIALAELRRVLKPGGRLHFLEHGLAPDEQVRRWQHRLEPIQKRLVGGCHLTRQPRVLLEETGFEIVDIDEFYRPGALKAVAAETIGVAVRSR